MLVVGIDPALRATGYAVIQGSPQGVRLQESGIIRPDDATSLPACLRSIFAELRTLLDRSRPNLVAVEDLYAAQRYPRTAIIMGHVRGVVYLAAAEAGIEVAALPPTAVKHAIAGFGGASKDQMQLAVQRLLRRAELLNSHVSDAAAMALTALSRSGVPLRLDGIGGPEAVAPVRAGDEVAR